MNHKFALFSGTGVAVAILVCHGRQLANLSAGENADHIIIAKRCALLEAEIARSRQELEALEKDRPKTLQSIALLHKIEFADGTIQEKPEEVSKNETDSIAKQEQQALSFRAHLVAQYAPFYYRVGLNAEQIDRFETMLTDHSQSLADIAAIAKTKELETDDPSVIELRTKADKTLHRAEKELLGEDGVNRLQEYERSLPARDFVGSIAENLYFTDAPLNADQAERLTQLIANNCAPYKQGGAVDMDEMDWQTVLHEFPTILAPKQSTAFMQVYQMNALVPQYMGIFCKKIGPAFEASIPH